MEWTTTLRYEFVMEVQDAMDRMVHLLPMFQSMPGNNSSTEICHTWEEFINGVPYIVNLCINTLQGAAGLG